MGAESFVEGDISYVTQEISVGWNLIAGPSFEEDFHLNSQIKKDHLLSAYVYDLEVWPSYSVDDDVSAELLYSKPFWVNSLAEGELIYPVSDSFLNPRLAGGVFLTYR